MSGDNNMNVIKFELATMLLHTIDIWPRKKNKCI